MRNGKWQLALLIVAILAVRRACAQDLTITGTVRDEAGAGLNGVKLILRSESNSYSISTVTKLDGTYALTPATAGAYRVEAEREGFQKATFVHVAVSSGSPVIVDFTLARMEVSHAARKREVAEAATGSQAEKASSVSGHQTPEAGADPARALSAVQLYDSPQLNSSQFTDPAAAGGYSNTIANNSRELVREYLQGQNSPAPSEQSENDVYRKGSELLSKSKYGPAIDVFQQGAQQFPRSVRLQIGLGLALYSRGRYGEAIRALTAASDIAPSDLRAYLFLAKASMALNQPSDEVVRHMERFAQLFPKDPLASYYYAMSLWKVRGRQDSKADLTQVESLLNRTLLLDAALPDAHLQLGILYADQQKPSQAIQEFQKAINLKRDLALAHYHLAQAYMRIGEEARAEQELHVYERLRNQQRAEPDLTHVQQLILNPK